MNADRSGRPDYNVIALLIAAMTFNCILAILNNNGIAASEQSVAIVQLAITIWAVCTVVTRRCPVPLFMAGAFYLILLLVGMSAAYKQALNLRFFYDILIPPLALLVGLSSRRLPLWVFTLIFLFIFASALLEYSAPQIFGAAINPLSYYANTRSWVTNQINDLTALEGLSLGAYRPGGAAVIGWGVEGHRAGGLFLEPLSLAYSAVIFAAFFFDRLNETTLPRLAALVSCLVLAAMADTRVAIALILILFLLNSLRNPPPLWLSSVLPIAMLLLAWGGYIYSNSGDPYGEVSFRLAITIKALAQMEVLQLLFGDIDTRLAGDSAVIYIIDNAGLFGYLIYIPLAAGLLLSPHPSRRCAASASLYLSVVALFGGVFLSIKTALLLGIVIGNTCTRTAAEHRSPRPSHAARLSSQSNTGGFHP